MLGIFIGKRSDSDKQNLITKQKIKNKEKILEFMRDNEKVVNNDIEKLLTVSDSTATRYLDQLEKEGKIKQIGKTGKAVYYILK